MTLNGIFYILRNSQRVAQSLGGGRGGDDETILQSHLVIASGMSMLITRPR